MNFPERPTQEKVGYQRTAQVRTGQERRGGRAYWGVLRIGPRLCVLPRMPLPRTLVNKRREAQRGSPAELRKTLCAFLLWGTFSMG
jgi:hypothetical protein